MSLNRRTFLTGASVVAVLGVIGLSQRGGGQSMAAEGDFAVKMTDDQWRAKLGDAAFDVLRHEGTERPFTSPLNDEHRAGQFACAGCDLPLFASDTKFESGTGWPSFYTFLPDSLGQTVDNSLFMTRTEVHCARCGGHQGHVFDDGPAPTGLRYCINGVAMKFVPQAA